MAFVIPLGDLVVRLTANASQFTRVMSKVETKMRGVADKLTRIGRKLTVALTLPVAAFGVVALREFAKFDDALTKSLAIMGHVTDEMRGLMGDLARAISRESVTSAEELARSYFFLASAGLDAAQSIKSLPIVERFAVAGAFDMALATDLLTDAQSALGLAIKDTTQHMKNMTRISDVLIKANTLANATAEQFSKSLVTKSASAYALAGKDLEELVSILAVFADRGIKAEQAGEKAFIVLRDLQTAAAKNAEAWRKMGLRVFDARGNLLPMADIIEQLTNRFKNLSDAEKTEAVQMLGFPMRSFSAIQALMGTSQQMRNYEKALRGAGGITQEVTEKQLKSFAAQMKILWNNVKDAAFQIGQVLVPFVEKAAKTFRDFLQSADFQEVLGWVKQVSTTLGEKIEPALKFVIEGIKQVVEWWRSFSAEAQRTIVILSALAVVAGPVLLGIGMALSLAVTLAGALATAFGFIGSVVSAIGAPVIAAVLAIAAAVAGVTYAIVGPEGLANAWTTAKTKVIEFAKNAFGFLVNFRENMGLLMGWLSQNWGNLLKDMVNLWLTMNKNLLKNAWVVVKTLFRLWLVFIGEFNKLIGKLFQIDFVDLLMQGLKLAARAVFDWGVLIGRIIWDALKGAFTGDGVEEEIERKFKGKGRKKKDRSFFGAIKGVLEQGAGELVGLFDGFKSSLTELPEFNLSIGGTELLNEAAGSVKGTAKKLETAQGILDKVKLPPVPDALTPSLGSGLGLPDMEKATRKATEFQVISERRFSLQGLARFGEMEREQSVHDEKLGRKMDTLIDITRTKTQTAVLG